MDKVFAVRFIGKTDKGLILRVLRQQAADGRRRQVQRLASLGIEAYLDRFLPTAVDIDGSNPVHILQVGTNLLIHNITYPVDTARTAHLQNHKVIGHLADIDLLQLHIEAVGESGCQFVHLLL